MLRTLAPQPLACSSRRCSALPATASRRSRAEPLSIGRAASGDQQPQESEATPAADAGKKKALGDALSRSLIDVANSSGRKNNGTNLVLTAGSEENWRQLDAKVNKYPIQRSFTAIGSGEDFVPRIVQCVSDVVGSVHVECVSQRSSSGGKYTSVTVGPVWLENGDQIIAIYANMKQTANIKWII